VQELETIRSYASALVFRVGKCSTKCYLDVKEKVQVFM